MSIGFVPPVGPGADYWYQGEPFNGDPRVPPGLARPIGWRVRAPDGTASFDKWGLLDTDWTPVGIPEAGTPTLAAIWAFGDGDAPLTDNVFNFHSGHFRFLGLAAGFGIQGAATAFYESATTPGDPRMGSDYFRRFYRVASLTGGFVADQFVGFDPAWNGTFAGLGNLEIESERIGFSHGTGAEIGPQEELLIGRQVWDQVGGFFDGPSTFPLPGNNPGQREDVRFDLYNGLDAGVAARHTLNGWGQYIGHTQPGSHGITAALETQADFQHVSTLANDGIGWFVRHTTDDPPRAIVDAYMVTASPNGAWGWEMWGDDGTGTLGRMFRCDWTNGAAFAVPLQSPAVTVPGVADFEPLTGITFAKPLAVTQTNLAIGAGTFGSIVSVEVDLTVVGSTVLAPAVPGKLFVPMRFWTAVITQTTGAATVAGSISAGNNATADNLFSAAIGANFIATAWVNGGVGSLNESSFPAAPFPVVGAFDLVVKVITPPTGPTVCKARFLIEGFYL